MFKRINKPDSQESLEEIEKLIIELKKKIEKLIKERMELEQKIDHFKEINNFEAIRALLIRQQEIDLLLKKQKEKLKKYEEIKLQPSPVKTPTESTSLSMPIKEDDESKLYDSTEKMMDEVEKEIKKIGIEGKVFPTDDTDEFIELEPVKKGTLCEPEESVEKVISPIKHEQPLKLDELKEERSDEDISKGPPSPPSGSGFPDVDDSYKVESFEKEKFDEDGESVERLTSPIKIEQPRELEKLEEEFLEKEKSVLPPSPPDVAVGLSSPSIEEEDLSSHPPQPKTVVSESKDKKQAVAGNVVKKAKRKRLDRSELPDEVTVKRKIYSGLSYFDRINPYKNFPLIVELSHNPIKKEKRKTDVVTGTRQVQKRKELEFKVNIVKVAPILPGCLIVPAYRIAKLKKKHQKLDFIVTPLVTGRIDGKVEFKNLEDDELLHTIEAPSLSRSTHVSKIIAILGTLAGAFPTIFSFMFGVDVNTVMTDQLSANVPSIASYLSGFNWLLVFEGLIIAVALGFAGLVSLRFRPKHSETFGEVADIVIQ